MHRIESNVQTGKKTTIQYTAEEEAAHLVAVAADLALLPERQAVDIRVERDNLLRLSDHTQLDDTPKNKVEWRVYRKELRDIPDQAGFPDTVIWPTDPT